MKTFKEINQLAESFKNSNPDAGIAQAYRQGYIDATRDKEACELTDDLFSDNQDLPTFEEFWKIYDYRKQKRNAHIYWDKLPMVDKISIMDRVRDYVASTKKSNDPRDRRTPRMHPSTYLNPRNRRWEDEIDVVTTNTSNANEQQLAFAQQSLNGLANLIADSKEPVR